MLLEQAPSRRRRRADPRARRGRRRARRDRHARRCSPPSSTDAAVRRRRRIAGAVPRLARARPSLERCAIVRERHRPRPRRAGRRGVPERPVHLGARRAVDGSGLRVCSYPERRRWATAGSRSARCSSRTRGGRRSEMCLGVPGKVIEVFERGRHPHGDRGLRRDQAQGVPRVRARGRASATGS